jgi:TPP-dependent pyruvate/acetoin dehydrogenase alpha subunit
MNVDNIAVRATSYGMPSRTVDGNDVIAVLEAVSEVRDYVLREGPYLLVCETYRILGHSKSDANRYRSKEEIEEWKQKCPIRRMRRYLLENKVFTDAELDEFEQQARIDLDEAVKYAESAPYPKIDTILDDVYA